MLTKTPGVTALKRRQHDKRLQEPTTHPLAHLVITQPVTLVGRFVTLVPAVVTVVRVKTSAAVAVVLQDRRFIATAVAAVPVAAAVVVAVVAVAVAGQQCPVAGHAALGQ